MRNTIQRFRPAFIVALFLVGALLLLLPFYRPVNVPFLFLFLGRLHPLILHFPIVLIVLALLFELTRRYNFLKVSENVIMILLIAAAVSTGVSIVAGFFLFASGDYSGNLMERHFWAGAITGSVVLITVGLYFLYRGDARHYPFYLSGLLLSNMSVGYTSHLGGSITHGREYLTEHLDMILHQPSGDDEERPESEMLVYQDMLAPVFESKCLSCHNSLKAKGNFLMASYADLFNAGKSGRSPVTAGLADSSELFHRVTLPLTDNDHMPPEGKTPLSDGEIALLKGWIELGATDTLLVRDAKKKTGLGQVIEQLMPSLTAYRRKASIAKEKNEAVRAELTSIAKRLSISIHPDSLDEQDLFTIAMQFPPAPFTNNDFRELSPFYESFSKVSLASSGIDDDGLYYVSQMTNVKKLYLQKTKLNGSGLVYLQRLPKLEVLNLSFTKVDDKAAIDLLNFPNLKEVYLYRTNTSQEVVDALMKYKPGLRILVEEGPYF